MEKKLSATARIVKVKCLKNYYTIESCPKRQKMPQIMVADTDQINVYQPSLKQQVDQKKFDAIYSLWAPLISTQDQ